MSLMSNMKTKALGYNRIVQFGLRVHVIVRESENEARDYASKLISNLDLDFGEDIRNRAQDSKSLGVSMQSELRSKADKDFLSLDENFQYLNGSISLLFNLVSCSCLDIESHSLIKIISCSTSQSITLLIKFSYCR